MTHVAVVGSWHNAFITAACLAHIGHRVTLVSEASTLSIHEPGLDEMIAKSREEGKLNIVADSYDESVDVVWLAIDTPLRDDDSPDVEPLIVALREARERFPRSDLLIIGSQVPIGFCQRVGRDEIEGWHVACVPENMRLGSGVRDFMSPERVIIGATDDATRDRVESLLYPKPEHPEIRLERRGRTIRCDLPTAEMIKHATNAMLATQISLANELAMIGEAHGVDTQLVAKAMKLDSRIGPKAYVRPGLGFAGGTLPRDLRALQGASRSKPHDWSEPVLYGNGTADCLLYKCTRCNVGRTEPYAGPVVGGVYGAYYVWDGVQTCDEILMNSAVPVVDAVLKVNDNVIEHIAQSVIAMMPKAPRTLCIMGYTYKADTDALRKSPVKQLATRIRRIGRGLGQDVNVVGFDPRFDDRRDELSALDDYEDRQFGLARPAHMPWNALQRHDDLHGGVDLFLVVTPLPAFKKLDWSKIAPAVVYDLCDGVDREAALAAGLTYKAIWQPTEKR